MDPMDQKEGYFKRQLYIVGNLGLFYVIIIALFGVPLMGTFVVILIKGMIDMRYVILVGGTLLIIALLWFLIKRGRRYSQKVKQEGLIAGGAFRDALSRGEPVQLSLFNGLMTLSCGDPKGSRALPRQARGGEENVRLLPDAVETVDAEDAAGAVRVIRHLEKLKALKADGLVTEAEFSTIKARLLNAMDDPG